MNQREHVLCVVAEESAEFAQNISKALRFGVLDRNYLEPAGPDNMERMVAELNDLMGAVRLAEMVGVLPSGWAHRGAQEKKMRKIVSNMEYAASVGALQRTEDQANIFPSDWRVMPNQKPKTEAA